MNGTPPPMNFTYTTDMFTCGIVARSCQLCLGTLYPNCTYDFSIIDRTSAKLLHTIHLSFQAHSDIMCRRCFSLLDRVDALEVEIQETKDEIVNKYQETVAVHGGRARRRKPATAKKSDYVFPKVGLRDNFSSYGLYIKGVPISIPNFQPIL